MTALYGRGRTYRSGNPARRRGGIRLPRWRPAGSALCSFALKGGRIGIHLASPPAKTPAGDLNGGGEFRATGQLVGSGPAELEQRADVANADQFIGITSSLPGVFRFTARRDFMVLWERPGLCRMEGLCDWGTRHVGVACQ